MTGRALRALLGAGIFLCACDAQVTSGYRGEKLLEIRGNILAGGGSPAEAALLWWAPIGDAGAAAGTRIATAGTFPAAFTLSIYRLPPDAAIIDFDVAPAGAAPGSGGPILRLPGTAQGAAQGAAIVCRAPAGWPGAAPGERAALASIAAVRPGSADDELADNVVGLAEGFAVVYTPGPAGGYRLMKLEWLATGAPGALSCDGAAPFLRLRAVDGGLEDTEIQIRIGAG